ALWVTPLVTDSCIFILTLWRTRNYYQKSNGAPTIHLFFRDGAIYFLAIFFGEFVKYFLFMPEDLKTVSGSFSQLLTATMVSRLVLNLRS
ncbi:hypothetical protein BDQ12DRAFT_573235, partial [Crucibulum laeve]